MMYCIMTSSPPRVQARVFAVAKIHKIRSLSLRNLRKLGQKMKWFYLDQEWDRALG